MTIPDDRLVDDGVGQRIRDARVALGLSQRELAAITGLSNAFISRVETGRRTPSAGTMLVLAEVFITTAVALATGDTTCLWCGRG